jgi:maltose/moltooligosaccharide transporter
VVGFLFPFIFTWIGLKNVAPEGVVPDSVIWSFYVGAAILILCVIYTTLKVKEWAPQEYAEYNGVAEDTGDQGKADWLTLLKNAPSTFWKVGLVQFFCWAGMLYMWTYVVDAVAETVWGTTEPTTTAYQEAANWTGVLYAIQAMGSVVWAALLPRFSNTKLAYSVSLILGGLGFVLIPFIPNMYGQILPFLLIGCGWAAMLAMPFTFVTNALQGYGHMGAYLGLFNGTICVPQIIAAILGGTILSLVGSHQSTMMIVAGVSFLIGSACVFVIKGKK